jgi:hypothetical protein
MASELLKFPKLSSSPQMMAADQGSVVVTRNIPRSGLVGSASKLNSVSWTSLKGSTSEPAVGSSEHAAITSKPTKAKANQPMRDVLECTTPRRYGRAFSSRPPTLASLVVCPNQSILRANLSALRSTQSEENTGTTVTIT